MKAETVEMDEKVTVIICLLKEIHIKCKNRAVKSKSIGMYIARKH